MKARRRQRGAFLLEIVIAVAVMAVIFAASGDGFTQALKIQTQLEIETANINALSAEISRLRSLPRSSFYEADGVTTRTSPLRYYRQLSIPGLSTASKMFAQLDVVLITISGAGGPLQVVVSARPVYSANGATVNPNGVGTIIGTPTSTLPNGIDLTGATETQTFIVL